MLTDTGYGHEVAAGGLPVDTLTILLLQTLTILLL